MKRDENLINARIVQIVYDTQTQLINVPNNTKTWKFILPQKCVTFYKHEYAKNYIKYVVGQVQVVGKVHINMMLDEYECIEFDNKIIQTTR